MPLVPDFLAGRTPPDLYHAYLEPAFEPWATALLGQVQPTGNVIDIACGTGLVSRMAAGFPQVGKVQAIDVAPGMVAKARELSAEAGETIRYLEASALDLPFADDVFDCALCQQGLQFFPDKFAGLREARRVLKPGAKAAFSTWCSAKDGNPAFAAFEEIIAAEFGSDLVPFGPFAFGDRQAIARLADEAGFKTQSLQSETRLSPLPDPRTFVLFDIAFLGRPAADGELQPILDFADPANDAVIERLIDHMTEATQPFQQPDGSLLVPMQAHILIAEA